VERLYKWGKVYEKKKELMRKDKEEHEMDENCDRPEISEMSSKIAKHLLPLSH